MKSPSQAPNPPATDATWYLRLAGHILVSITLSGLILGLAMGTLGS